MKRIPQPQVNPALRDTERHDFWPGFILALIAGVLLLCGAGHVTGVETQDGNSAWEFQLVRAFTSGGLEFTEPGPPPDPSSFSNPDEAAAAMDRAARAEALTLGARYRVNIGAADPCPT